MPEGVLDSLPMEAIDYLIGVITGQVPLDRVKAVRAAMQAINYLVDLFFPASAKASSKVRDITFKKARVSKDQIANALRDLKGGSKPKFAIPSWLLPILLSLLEKWLGK